MKTLFLYQDLIRISIKPIRYFAGRLNGHNNVLDKQEFKFNDWANEQVFVQKLNWLSFRSANIFSVNCFGAILQKKTIV